MSGHNVVALLKDASRAARTALEALAVSRDSPGVTSLGYASSVEAVDALARVAAGIALDSVTISRAGAIIETMALEAAAIIKDRPIRGDARG